MGSAPVLGPGPAGVDGLDAGVSVRTAQNLTVQHPWKADISAVSRPPGYFVVAIVADGPGAPHIDFLVGQYAHLLHHLE